MAKIAKIAIVLFIFLFSAQAGEQYAFAEISHQTVKDCIGKDCGSSSGKDEKSMTKKEEPASESSSPMITIWDFIKMIFALLFVIALLYGLLKFINKRSKNFQQSKMVENLGGTSLGGNRSVQLVKVNGRILILGVGENIQLLKDIDSKKEFEEMMAHFNERSEGRTQPVDFVTKWITTFTKKNESESQPNSSFQLMLKEQMMELRKGRKKVLDEMDKKEQE
ncbi:flagellar biosynthetic protein FliO [Falsibacillus pallidus]|uniref:Flagellar protein FliO/FliZ n=1 Tax=Falsibacillus pallidus TaxID=493781 RepID=A0A370GW06_9BACI|nr:flagellar biosynthetic protein FliO [Falsibacillus pallidus]RDI47446.1 flagellar protein FliO/FliZ [Falsibacillus pallidus]